MKRYQDPVPEDEYRKILSTLGISSDQFSRLLGYTERAVDNRLKNRIRSEKVLEYAEAVLLRFLSDHPEYLTVLLYGVHIPPPRSPQGLPGILLLIHNNGRGAEDWRELRGEVRELQDKTFIQWLLDEGLIEYRKSRSDDGESFAVTSYAGRKFLTNEVTTAFEAFAKDGRGRFMYPHAVRKHFVDEHGNRVVND